MNNLYLNFKNSARFSRNIGRALKDVRELFCPTVVDKSNGDSVHSDDSVTVLQGWNQVVVDSDGAVVNG